jgi:hypothetical protein
LQEKNTAADDFSPPRRVAARARTLARRRCALRRRRPAPARTLNLRVARARRRRRAPHRLPRTVSRARRPSRGAVAVMGARPAARACSHWRRWRRKLAADSRQRRALDTRGCSFLLHWPAA